MNLRPMTMADADKMLEWKNYPETRRFAIASHDEIKMEDHCKWLEQNIQYFQIIQDKDEVLGAIRIQNDEVSIWVDRTHWNQGVASKVLKSLWPLDNHFAKIVAENIASMRAFINAGFKPVDYVNEKLRVKYYIFKK